MDLQAGIQRTFNIQCDDSGATIPIHIFEQSGIKAENLSLSTWGASYILANQLHKLQSSINHEGSQVETRFVLELGAGTGLVGLSAAAIWKTNVVVTDLEPVLPAITTNISLNKPTVGDKISHGILGWNHPEIVRKLDATPELPSPAILADTQKAHTILAADTLYTADHPELIANVIRTWLDPEDVSARAILCYPLRVAYLDDIRRFWELMEGMGFICLDEGRAEGGEEWGEVASTPYEWCVWGWCRSIEEL